MSGEQRRDDDEVDIVDMKKAIATGSAKEGPAVSSSASSFDLAESVELTKGNWSVVPPIVCYCLASILMTVVNKVSMSFLHRRGAYPTCWQFVVSGRQFNMNFLLLCIQSTVCVSCVYVVKKLGIISFRDWDTKDAKAWFPISFLLVSVIYTGSKSLVSALGCPSPASSLPRP